MSLPWFFPLSPAFDPRDTLTTFCKYFISGRSFLQITCGISDTVGMGISMFTVKPNLTPHDQLRLLEAWEAWGVPIEQQQAWRIQIFGLDNFLDLLDYQTFEGLSAKEDQLELPLEYPDLSQPNPLF